MKIDWKMILKRVGRALAKAALQQVENDVRDRLDRTGSKTVKEVKR